MKIHKSGVIMLGLLMTFLYYGCDDSGFQSSTPKGLISFSEKRLSHLDQNVDGTFELWLRLDSSGNIRNFSLGRFNINTSGAVVDTGGNPMKFVYQGDTNSLYQATKAFVTVEPPGDNNSEPTSAVLLSGQTVFTSDSIYADLRVTGADALGSTGNLLMTSPPACYIMNTPTSGSSTCKQGIWLCDPNGSSYFQNGMQLNAPGWVYESWLVDKSNPNSYVYYSMGRFRDPFGPDWDGAGPCAGTGSPFSKPGQDWVQANCPQGKPPIQDVSNGNYEIWLTVEPSYETPGSAAYNTPFFLRPFEKTVITINCNLRDNLYCVGSRFPEGRLKISYRTTFAR